MHDCQLDRMGSINMLSRALSAAYCGFAIVLARFVVVLYVIVELISTCVSDMPLAPTWVARQYDIMFSGFMIMVVSGTRAAAPNKYTWI